MRKKVIWSASLLFLFTVLLASWYFLMPHRLSDQQVLERSAWALRQADGAMVGTVDFTKSEVKIAGQSYDYHFSKDTSQLSEAPSDSSVDGQITGTLIIDDGHYAGTYALESTDSKYRLKQCGQVKYGLEKLSYDKAG